MNTNHVILIGYVGQHLACGQSGKGTKRVAIRLATHTLPKNGEGMGTLQTIWHDVVAWGGVAFYAERNFVKGSRIMVQGVIEYRTYPDNTGHTRYVTQIRAQSLMNLDR